MKSDAPRRSHPMFLALTAHPAGAFISGSAAGVRRRLLARAFLRIGVPTVVLFASFPAISAPSAAPAPHVDHLRIVSEKRIFFGHQSVGANILDGVRDLAREAGVPVRIVREKEAGQDTGMLVDAYVGQNTQPLSKIDAFEKAMEEWARRVDVAFFKFCYVDFDASSDPKALFEKYAAAHERLRTRYPRTTWVHVTVPLTVTQRGLKGYLKNLLGKGAWGERENVKRHEFNELMRSRYAGVEPLFDLARLESEDEGKSPHGFSRDGAIYPSLVPSFSDDGEHLNEKGRKHVARALVRLLASLP